LNAGRISITLSHYNNIYYALRGNIRNICKVGLSDSSAITVTIFYSKNITIVKIS